MPIKIFADGADLQEMVRLAKHVDGFTTNPTLIRRAGITDCRTFMRELLGRIPDLPVSFGVLSEEIDVMRRQAETISAWGKNVYVKIPIMTANGNSTLSLIRALSHDGIKVNVTAVLHLAQVESVAAALVSGADSYVSVFAGRIADTGRDPVPMMTHAVYLLSGLSKTELIWASPREVLNVTQAEKAGCDAITLTPDLIAKLDLSGADLFERSRETVREFQRDARGLTL